MALILVGLCLMTAAAVIAWQLYADKLPETQPRGQRQERNLAPRPTALPDAP